MKTTTMLKASSDALANIPRDNGAYDDFWFFVDGYNLTICEQKLGERPTQRIKIPIATARKIVSALTREYQIKGSKG